MIGLVVVVALVRCWWRPRKGEGRLLITKFVALSTQFLLQDYATPWTRSIGPADTGLRKIEEVAGVRVRRKIESSFMIGNIEK